MALYNIRPINFSKNLWQKLDSVSRCSPRVA